MVSRNRLSVTTGDIEYRFLFAAIGIPTSDDLQVLQRRATRILLSLNDKTGDYSPLASSPPLQRPYFSDKRLFVKSSS